MKKLNKIQTIIFLCGGALMVIGAGCFAFMVWQKVVCWLFLVGTLMFTVMQSAQIYEGRSLTIQRLKRIQGIANLLFVLAGISMVDTVNLFFESFFHNRIDYLVYLYNKWVVLLLIAAILEIYTTHRISHELSKE